jgi:hypothetical protein
MVQKQVYRSLNAVLDMPRALRVPLIDIGKHPIELGCGRAGDPQLHRPYLAQMARISASVAKSPRASAASDSSSSAASSGVNR